MILYILLCGYPPFDGDNNAEIFKSIIKNDIEFDSEDWEDISPEAIDLIKKMLTKNQSERISLEDAQSHPWIKMFKDNPKAQKVMNIKFLDRLKSYRAPKKF